MPQFEIRLVEVPAAAIAVDLFDAAFFSIGSNDLTQVRHGGRTRHRRGRRSCGSAQPGGASDLVGHVAEHGKARGRDVSLCGDAGGDPLILRPSPRSRTAVRFGFARRTGPHKGDNRRAELLRRGKQAGDKHGKVACVGNA